MVDLLRRGLARSGRPWKVQLNPKHFDRTPDTLNFFVIDADQLCVDASDPSLTDRQHAHLAFTCGVRDNCVATSDTAIFCDDQLIFRMYLLSRLDTDLRDYPIDPDRFFLFVDRIESGRAALPLPLVGLVTDFLRFSAEEDGKKEATYQPAPEAAPVFEAMLSPVLLHEVGHIVHDDTAVLQTVPWASEASALEGLSEVYRAVCSPPDPREARADRFAVEALIEMDLDAGPAGRSLRWAARFMQYVSVLQMKRGLLATNRLRFAELREIQTQPEMVLPVMARLYAGGHTPWMERAFEFDDAADALAEPELDDRGRSLGDTRKDRQMRHLAFGPGLRNRCQQCRKESGESFSAFASCWDGRPLATEVLEAKCMQGDSAQCESLVEKYGDSKPSDRFLNLAKERCEAGQASFCRHRARALELSAAVPPDEIIRLFEEACRAGDYEACFQESRVIAMQPMSRETRARAIVATRHGCSYGHIPCCTAVGLLAHGTRMTTLLTQGLERGCAGQEPFACVSLAKAYESGKDIPRDVAKALHYYSQACELGGMEGCVKGVVLRRAQTELPGTSKDSSPPPPGG